MALHPFVLSLAEDLGRLSLATSPFYHVRHPTYLALASGGDQPHHDKKSSRPISTIGKDGFQLCMDVQHFKPSELNVKVVDNSIIIEGQHEEREDDHGYIARHFVRRYALPKGYDPNKVVSTLSSDGVLTVSVPKPQSEDKSSITIPIQQVGPAHLNVKENPEDEIAKVVVEDVKDEEDVKD